MTNLREIVHLLHTADRRWTTLHLTGREWTDFDWARYAFMIAHGQIHGGPSLPRPATEPFVGFLPWAMWASRPARRRLEYRRHGEMTVELWNRDEGWRWSQSAPPLLSHAREPFAWEVLVDPSALLSCVDLHDFSREKWGGRSALRALASPRTSVDTGPVVDPVVNIPDVLGVGADEYIFLFDAALGLILKAEARLRGEVFRVIEMTSVDFDGPLSERLFDAPDEAPQDDASESPARRHQSLQLGDLAAAVPFSVYVPSPGPSRSDPPDAVVDSGGPDDQQFVLVSYGVTSDGSPRPSENVLFTESDRPLPDMPWITWRQAGRVWVGRDSTTIPQQLRVRLRVGRTFIEISSDQVAEDQLLTYARSLVHLPMAPPQLKKH